MFTLYRGKNKTNYIYPQNTPQTYTLAQAHRKYMFFPRAFAISWHSLKLLLLMEAVTLRFLRSSQSRMIRPMAGEL